MIIHADIFVWARDYDGPKFHALLCDPPYHLTSITDRFGKQGAAPAQFGTDGAFARASKGFMGKDWDGGDIAFRPDTWAAIATHLYPGAWGMAFAGSRGWHRMACAIEDAGLIMQPTMFGWGYGSGFPKATNIAAAIDARAFRAWLDLHPDEQAALKAARLAEQAARKAHDVQATKEARDTLKALSVAYKALAGLTGAVVATKRHQPKFAAAELGYREKDNGFNSRDRATFDVMGAATEAASYWLGHRYGGQAIKPALEPIIVFQKPYEGSALDCITATGAGALNIQGGRIGSAAVSPNGGAKFNGDVYGKYAEAEESEYRDGRWPANLILSHAPTCNGACAPGCPVAALGAQSGETEAKQSLRGAVNLGVFGGIVDGGYTSYDNGAVRGHNDSGTAARFFFQADYMAERLELADAIQYVAKASRAEREAGLDPRQTALMRLLDEDGEDFEEIEQAVYSGKRYTVRRCPEHDGTISSGSNSYSCGCSLVRGAQFAPTTISDGRETPIDNPYQRGETTRRNTHPTIKPLSLTSYLSRLLLPPVEYGPRRILIPFAGAGSECIGAMLAGWEEITGVELGADHVAIADARMTYWQQRRWEFDDISRKLTVKAPEKMPKGQLDMFIDELAS